MIRPFTLVCLAMACGSGLYLYQCKHQARVLDREIATTIKQTEATRDQIGMLRAEWAQLNAPERVTDLAQAHTTLQAAKPAQFTTLADLAGRLPPVMKPVIDKPPTDMPDQVAEASSSSAAPAPAAPTTMAQAKPTAVPPAKPTFVASGAPAAAENRAVRSAEATRAAEPTQRAELSHPAEPARPAPSARRGEPIQAAAVSGRLSSSERAVNADATAPGTVGAAVLRAMRARDQQASAEPAASRPSAPTYAPPAYAQPAYSQPSYAAPTYAAPNYAPAYAAPAVSSVLGTSRVAVPPPVPFAQR